MLAANNPHSQKSKPGIHLVQHFPAMLFLPKIPLVIVRYSTEMYPLNRVRIYPCIIIMSPGMLSSEGQDFNCLFNHFSPKPMFLEYSLSSLSVFMWRRYFPLLLGRSVKSSKAFLFYWYTSICRKMTVWVWGICISLVHSA